MLKSIEQLREIFAVGNKLKPYNNFKQRTFDFACKEINSIYDIGLSYEELKEGRKVTAVRFSFKPTSIIKRLDQAGIAHNTYVKPSIKKQNIKVPKNREILKNQLAFKDLQDKTKFESSNEKFTSDPKSIGSILTPFLQKFLPRKK
jgi:plasmid replication initiation protein